MLATILFRTFYLPVCYLKTLEINEDTRNYKFTVIRIRVFKNRMQRRIFGPKRDEITGLRKLKNEGHHEFLLFSI